MKTFFTSILFIFTIQLSSAQNVIQELQDYIQSVREGSFAPVPQSLLSETEQAEELLNALKTYQADSNSVIRTRAYNIGKRLGQGHPVQAIRQQAINQQIKALADADIGLRVKAINALTGFKNTDFTSNQEQRIINGLNAAMPHLEKYAMLVGYMNNDAAIAPLKQVEQQISSGWTKFNIQLALARRGDKQATTAVLNKMKTATINDDFIYDLSPLLVYTRNKEVFKFLEDIIFSEEANCNSANPNRSVDILCGYRLLEYMAPAIEGSPLTVDEYGELEVTNYEQALQDFRDWLLQNPNYSLVENTY
ncbi:hypothetical protein GCM10027429_21390 [Marivirga atlantica]|uniref:Uncharacterized protein n=1 Tax=Marivirga atlantica TaxID=1548457 RepID=A0A937DK09_9BACT|nr:hypothetical protein [Marivirga atlantica]MBL0765756.1 hypothetical protein [Marivirga atlantica]